MIAAAVMLRLWHVGHGLPDFLEEAIPLRLALGMTDPATGRVDWNPHQFNYPSLSVYLHFLLQGALFHVGRLAGQYETWADYLLRFHVDPAPMVIPARLLGIACDALAVLGVMRIALRLRPDAALLAGSLAALAPTLILTSRAVFCDSLMAAFAVWAVERMSAWPAGGRTRDLAPAALLVGLAAGSKYPAALLVLPLLVRLVSERGAAGVRAWIALAALAFGSFLATTPFALLAWPEFLRDLSFEGAHAAGGHLGSVGQRSFGFHAANLVANLGWAGVLFLLGSLALVAGPRERRDRVVTMALALASFAIPISLARIDADRYLAPVLLLATPLVAAAAHELAGRLTLRTGSVLWRIAPAALLVPVALAGIPAAAGGGDTTQMAARRWCEEHIGADRLIVQEGYSAQLPSVLRKVALASTPEWRLASARARARVDSIRAFHVVAIPLQVAGNVTAPANAGTRAEVEILTHASLLNRAYYDPRLFAGADYLMTSSAVRGRFTASPSRYPEECRFYEFLDRHAVAVAQFAPGRGRSGPEIRVYRLGDGFVRATAALGALPADWWAAAVPAAHRDGATDLGPVYGSRIRPFVSELARECLLLGRPQVARQLAAASLAVDSTDVDAAAVAVAAANRMQDWRGAVRVADRMLARSAHPDVAATFGLLRAQAHLRLGRTGEAARALETLVQASQPGTAIGREARRWRDSVRVRRD